MSWGQPLPMLWPRTHHRLHALSHALAEPLPIAPATSVAGAAPAWAAGLLALPAALLAALGLYNLRPAKQDPLQPIDVDAPTRRQALATGATALLMNGAVPMQPALAAGQDSKTVQVSLWLGCVCFRPHCMGGRLLVISGCFVGAPWGHCLVMFAAFWVTEPVSTLDLSGHGPSALRHPCPIRIRSALMSGAPHDTNPLMGPQTLE